MAIDTTTTATFAEYAAFFAGSTATAISVVHGDTFAVVTRDGYVLPCDGEDEMDRIMSILGLPTPDAELFRCTCGRTVRHDAPGNSRDFCPWCGTRPTPEYARTIGFDTGHSWYGDESSDFRCYDCDGRHHSHRRYPGDYDYDAIVAHAATRYATDPTATR